MRGDGAVGAAGALVGAKVSSSTVMGNLRAYSCFTRLIALNLSGSGEHASALGE